MGTYLHTYSVFLVPAQAVSFVTVPGTGRYLVL